MDESKAITSPSIQYHVRSSGQIDFHGQFFLPIFDALEYATLWCTCTADNE